MIGMPLMVTTTSRATSLRTTMLIITAGGRSSARPFAYVGGSGWIGREGFDMTWPPFNV